MSIQYWYANQTPREQFIVALVALVSVVALMYLFVVEPLNAGIVARQSSVAAQQQDLQWMQQEAAKISGQNPGGVESRRPIDKPPYLLLDEAITRAKIKKPDRVTPDGGQGAKAQFSSVDFDKLLQVLGGLEQTYGLTVKTMNVSKKDEGLVSARLSLEVEQ